MPDPTFWQWSELPRDTPFDIIGDVTEVNATGFAAQVGGVEHVSGLLASGMPDGGSLTIRWELVAQDEVLAEITCDNGESLQRYTYDGTVWSVAHEMLVVTEAFWNKGHAVRLMKNLLPLYDRIGISAVSARANHVSGGHIWAILGGRAVDPDQQRRELPILLRDLIEQGEIHADFEEPILKLIRSAGDFELMQRLALLQSPDEDFIGLALLVKHSWDAEWDLADETQRQYLKETLDGFPPR